MTLDNFIAWWDQRPPDLEPDTDSSDSEGHVMRANTVPQQDNTPASNEVNGASARVSMPDGHNSRSAQENDRVLPQAPTSACPAPARTDVIDPTKLSLDDFIDWWDRRLPEVEPPTESSDSEGLGRRSLSESSRQR